MAESPLNPHFFQPLLPDFHSFLNIPVKFFSVYIEGQNKEKTMKLRSDASKKIWKVQIENRKLTIGWKEFAIAHDYRIGDVIVFRHEGDLMFHVTCLGPNFCEIQYVHANGNDDDQNNIRMFPRKKHTKKSSSETETESFSSDKSCFVAYVTDSNLREDTRCLPKNFVRPNGLNKESNKICLMSEGVRTWTLVLKFRNSSRTFYMTAGWRNFCNENGLEPGDSITFKLETNNTGTPLLRFSTSESKSVSTEHCSKTKRETCESSQRMSSSSSSLSETRFVTLNVTPASLKSSRLHLPQSFTRINNLENAEGKKVTLLDKHGVEWPVNVVMDRRYTRLRFGLGLKDFFKAIHVKEYESFVLELIKEETTTPLMFKFCSKFKT